VRGEVSSRVSLRLLHGTSLTDRPVASQPVAASSGRDEAPRMAAARSSSATSPPPPPGGGERGAGRV